MSFDPHYARQVELLLQTLPFIAEHECFALHGGTAINLFVRDLPRLSVDIDLTYLPVEARQESLSDIEGRLAAIAERVRRGNGDARAELVRTREGHATKLVASRGLAQVKVEVNPVVRGAVNEPKIRTVTPTVMEIFGFAEARVVAFQDLYAGKIVAALDRQHPRDLFDIHVLLAEDAIDDALRRAFLVYLLSHNRPFHEVLAPHRQDLRAEFERGFVGMARTELSIRDLEDAREALIEGVVANMPQEHRKFLLSFARDEPAWHLLGNDGARDLPAVMWRQQNLRRLSAAARSRRVLDLEQVLSE